MAPLKVVALVSGGKDSFFSILHCIANGHDVVALANLHPPLKQGAEAVEDMDSYMYQTIGHEVIPLYEKALRLPLYRQEIIGSALNQDKSYGLIISRNQADIDETESLVPLLRMVQAAHPEVNAVSTGAILSDYQRTRVESVALRLGLTPISYLWQWPSLPPHTQSSLLEDMAAVGQDSRIVKVASGGLDDSFLWQNVADKRTTARLTKAAQRFGSSTDGAVLGEGGEYETLAVDGPSPLWKAKIVVDNGKQQVVQGEAGSAALRLREPLLIPKEENVEHPTAPRIPPSLNPRFEEMLIRMCNEHLQSQSVAPNRVSDSLPPDSERFDPAVQTHTDGAVCLISSRTARGQTAAAQMLSIMEALNDTLQNMAAKPRLASIAYTTIILRDMAHFAEINPVYGGYFTEPSPPARVTIACADVLPDSCDVMLGATFLQSVTSLGASARRGLHVQSRSYWAPANIGPYSQAVKVPISIGADVDDGEVVYVAGQIPLVPATMELIRSDTPHRRPSEDFAHQAVLALQHLTRIGEVMKVKRWVAAIAFVVSSPPDSASSFAQMARQAWRFLHQREPTSKLDADEAEDFDVWNETHGARHGALRMQQFEPEDELFAGTNADLPPMWVVEVDALPRGASIEWVGYGTTKSHLPSEEIRHLHYLLHTFQHHIL